ncbi:hypothetical protein [Actinomarinicola tropica]|uniref:DUF3558 domain-containing protein n=1 Tax=Actinomarinicola tropica TaxID=2789776 RepID=A0A5Q2RHH5_9ACTN|nr:hypothetical protein [Actinomarinicola tropica]QGG96298.1 hypothetical protein GH723_15000 [Actinomarinicola tropica]
MTTSVRRASRRAALLLAALTLLAAACGDGDGGVAPAPADSDTTSETTAADASGTDDEGSEEEDTEDASTDADSESGDEQSAERDANIDGLDHTACESFDLSELNAVTGIDFTFLHGDQDASAEGAGEATCLFGLEEGSTNYLYVDWQVRWEEFAAGNYGAALNDADVGNVTSMPYELGDYEDATLIVEGDGDGLQVLALDAPAVYQVRVALADEITDPDAVAAALLPVLEQLESAVFD